MSPVKACRKGEWELILAQDVADTNLPIRNGPFDAFSGNFKGFTTGGLDEVAAPRFAQLAPMVTAKSVT